MKDEVFFVFDWYSVHILENTQNNKKDPQMKPYLFFISFVWALTLSILVFAVSISVSYVVIGLMRAVLETHLIFIHNGNNESPFLLGFLGLCAFPYSFVYVPISIFLMSIKTIKLQQKDFLKLFYENCRTKIIWRTVIGTILWILLFITGIYIV